MPLSYEYKLTVLPSAIDANNHVNNLEYMKWMLEAAIRHSDAVGCTEATRAAGATWVVAEHHIEYLRPAFEGDAITVITWVNNARKARSMRQYEVKRDNDGKLLAKGYTDWVFVRLENGRPLPIPEEISHLFDPTEPVNPPVTEQLA